MPELLTPKQAAKILNVHVETLGRWRLHKQGPAFKKLGDQKNSVIRYARDDIDKFLAASAR